jgi:hypothetical protein
MFTIFCGEGTNRDGERARGHVGRDMFGWDGLVSHRRPCGFLAGLGRFGLNI